MEVTSLTHYYCISGCTKYVQKEGRTLFPGDAPGNKVRPSLLYSVKMIGSFLVMMMVCSIWATRLLSGVM
jgi:hypothetical protein